MVSSRMGEKHKRTLLRVYRLGSENQEDTYSFCFLRLAKENELLWLFPLEMVFIYKHWY